MHRVIYSIEISRSAQRSLANIEPQQRSRIADAIRALSSEPRPHGARKLTNRSTWRIRIGSFRVLYETDDNRLRILVVTIGHRRDVYRP